MNVPANLSYTKSHEWARHEERDTVVGITSHAQEELRDVVFVELPKVGKVLKQGEPAAVIESVKAAADFYAPISGTILSGEGGALESVTGSFSNGVYWLLNAAWLVYNQDNPGHYPDSGSLAHRNSASWADSDPTENAIWL